MGNGKCKTSGLWIPCFLVSDTNGKGRFDIEPFLTPQDASVANADACSFNQPLNRWVVSGVTSMAFMFRSAKAFDQTLQDWKVSSVADMHGMFLYTNKFNRPLNDWDVSSVKTMQWMFGLTRLYNQPLDKWNVSSVINSSKMFLHASAFNQNLCSWENEFVPRQSMMDLQGMFKSSACPRQDDPDLTLHPPSPFCHGCD